MIGIGKARYSFPSFSGSETAIASDPSHKVTMIVCQSCLEYIESCGKTQQLRPGTIIGDERIAGTQPVRPSSKVKTHSNKAEVKETSVIDHTKTESSRARKRALESEMKDSIEWTEEEISLVDAILREKSFQSARYGFSINLLQLEDLFLEPPYCKLSLRSSRSVLMKIHERLLDAQATADPHLNNAPIIADSRGCSDIKTDASASLTLLCDAANMVLPPGISEDHNSIDDRQIEAVIDRSLGEAKVIEQRLNKFVKPKRKKLRR